VDARMEFLLWLEENRFATWVRESGSIWGYPTILFLHTLGLATVAGLSSGLNLRLLGFARKLPLASLTPFITVIWAAFAVTAASGAALLIADATTKMLSPVFYVKMVFVGLALFNLHLLSTRVFHDPAVDRTPLTSHVRLLAITSLLFWVGATTAGRLMAYLGPVSGLF
jgi:hypothetical protein